MGKIKNISLNFIGLALTTLIVLFFSSVPALAIQAITQGYDSAQNLPAGSLVSIKQGSSTSVVSANSGNANSLVGVVVNNNSSQVSITSGSNQLQVATGGVNQVLVSDLNGKIETGDAITASPIDGVGMLATQNAEVIGTAQGAFPNTTASKETVTDANGQKQTINIGNVPVLISVGYFTKQPTKSIVPAVIQNLANALAGKPVKALPIIISLLIFIITLIVVVSIIYSMVRGSIISVGRNPMAQAAVYRNVIQLSALVIGILAVALIAIYLILTRIG